MCTHPMIHTCCTEEQKREIAEYKRSVEERSMSECMTTYHNITSRLIAVKAFAIERERAAANQQKRVLLSACYRA